LDDALSLTVTVPDFAPFDVGENVTLIVQLAPARMLFPQVEVMANCAEAFTAEIFNSVAPVLVSLTVCGALVVPAACFLKVSGVVGEKVTTPVFRRAMTELDP